MIPEQIKTKDGCVQVQVLPWMQYIRYRARHHGVKYLFKNTSAGYPRIFSLGYYSSEMKEIVVAKVGNWRLRVKHEEGHANGLGHVMIRGDVMHPYGSKRGEHIHVCTYQLANAGKCTFGNVLSENCGEYRSGCPYLQRALQ